MYKNSDFVQLASDLTAVVSRSKVFQIKKLTLENFMNLNRKDTAKTISGNFKK